MLKDCRRREYNNKFREWQTSQQPQGNLENGQDLSRTGAMGRMPTSQN